jgi:hypothetical protein
MLLNEFSLEKGEGGNFVNEIFVFLNGNFVFLNECGWDVGCGAGGWGCPGGCRAYYRGFYVPIFTIYEHLLYEVTSSYLKKTLDCFKFSDGRLFKLIILNNTVV